MGEGGRRRAGAGLTADDHRHRAIRAHRHEEQRRVLQVVVVVLGEEDGEAGDGDADGEEGEEEAVAEAVGQVGDEHGEGEGGGPGGHGVELRLDGGVAVGADDAGGEEGVACVGWVGGYSMGRVRGGKGMGERGTEREWEKGGRVP